MILHKPKPPVRLLLFLLIVLFSFQFFTSCFAPSSETILEETILSEEVGASPPLPEFKGTIAIIYNNDIFLLNSSLIHPRQITFNSDREKNLIALSHDISKIVYLNQAGVPTIIDTSGNILASVSVSNPVKDIGWSPNDETLYMLIGDDVQFYGPAISLPDFSSTLSSDFEAHSFHMAQNGNFAYLYDQKEGVQDGNGSYRRWRIIEGTTVKNQTIWSTNKEYFFRYLRFSVDGSVLLESKFHPRDGLDIGEESFVSLRNTNQNSGMVISGNQYKNAFGISPDGNSIIYGNEFIGRNSGTPVQHLMITSLPISAGSSQFLTTFDATDDKIYIDWKP